MKKALMMLVLAAAMTPAGTAATMCDGLVVSVGSSVPTSCMAGVFTFDNLRLVSPTGFGPGILSVTIGAPVVTAGGLDVQLPFSVAHPNVLPGQAGDFLFIYQVTSSAGIVGVNTDIGGGANNIRLTETVCSGPRGGALGTSCQVPPDTLLASFFALTPEGPAQNSATFAPTNFISVLKDIQFRDDTSSLSDFVNGHTAVPEPGTVLLMGSALLGLAALRRRKQ